VDREYDIFEKLPDGSVMWCAFVRGVENAARRLTELGAASPNEHFAIHTPSREIVARVNVPASDAADFSRQKIA
jgi:hypothetical protein